MQAAPEQIAYLARGEAIAQVGQAVAIGRVVKEQGVVIEGLRPRQSRLQALLAAGEEDFVPAAGQAVDAETKLALVGAEGVDKHIVDIEHRAEIDPEPQTCFLPAADRAAAAAEAGDQVGGIHITVEEEFRSGDTETGGYAAALQGPQ